MEIIPWTQIPSIVYILITLEIYALLLDVIIRTIELIILIKKYKDSK